MGSGARVVSRSAAAYERALELLPGGVNSPVRAMRQIGREPIFVARGEGGGRQRQERIEVPLPAGEGEQEPH